MTIVIMDMFSKNEVPYVEVLIQLMLVELGIVQNDI